MAVGGLASCVECGMPLEIERKFLVDASRLPPLDAWPVPFEASYIVQSYLKAKDSKVSSERVRQRIPTDGGPCKYTHTKKVRVDDGVHHEDECEVSKRSYNRLLKRADPSMVVISKVRRVFGWPGDGKDWIFELDFFSAPHDGLVLLEIELPYVGTDFPMPPFIPVVREVTKERGYSNAALARAGKWTP